VLTLLFVAIFVFWLDWLPGSSSFSNGFSWGASYTGARRKTIGTFDPFLTEAENKARNYQYATGANGSRPHVLTINYNYQVPGLGKIWDNAIVKGVADGWQISGISSFLTGTHSSFSYSFTGAPFNDMTGGGIGGARVTLACDPTLPRNERTLTRQFKTECIQPGGPTTSAGDIYYLGKSTNDEWINMGYSNHDITIFKNFAMASRRNLQVRIEMYNAFNALEPGTVNTAAQFNFATGEQTNQAFGTVTAARTASQRVIQLGLRFTF